MDEGARHAMIGLWVANAVIATSLVIAVRPFRRWVCGLPRRVLSLPLTILSNLLSGSRWFRRSSGGHWELWHVEGCSGGIWFKCPNCHVESGYRPTPGCRGTPTCEDYRRERRGTEAPRQDIAPSELSSGYEAGLRSVDAARFLAETMRSELLRNEMEETRRAYESLRLAPERDLVGYGETKTSRLCVRCRLKPECVALVSRLYEEFRYERLVGEACSPAWKRAFVAVRGSGSTLQTWVHRPDCDFIPRGDPTIIVREGWPDDGLLAETGAWSFQCLVKKDASVLHHFLNSVLPILAQEVEVCLVHSSDEPSPRTYRLKDGTLSLVLDGRVAVEHYSRPIQFD